MILEHLISHGLFYAVVVTGFILVVMVTTSPCVWGYNDYPQAIKDKVPPQTKSEKKLAMWISLPWFLFALGFPIYSTLVLKAKLAGDLSLGVAFLNLLVLFLLATGGDLVILDWWIVSKMTPRFVVIPGTRKEDYKDFSHHIKGHARALMVAIPIFFILAAILSYF